MSTPWQQQLELWREFYLLLGTVAATLMGLLFVIVSLGRCGCDRKGNWRTGVPFPHRGLFTTALLLSAFMMTPHMTPRMLGAILIFGSIGGLCYLVYTGAHKQWRVNQLPRVDWLWFVALPILSYLLILFAAVGIWMETASGLYAMQAATLLLIVIGIRNAWDVVLWITQQLRD